MSALEDDINELEADLKRAHEAARAAQLVADELAEKYDVPMVETDDGDSFTPGIDDCIMFIDDALAEKKEFDGLRDADAPEPTRE